jgi:diphthine synthase
MLYLIGLGLDKKDLSLSSLEAIKKCKKIYLEHYTTTLPYTRKELEKIIKKKIQLIEREKVESEFLIKEAKKHNTALFVYGDPLIATTHITLINDAKKAKVKTKVFHNGSVITAISQTGLQIYKFGKTASIPRWQENYKPTSFYDIIKDNQTINAHTLVLIDLGLSLEEALYELNEASNNQINNILICSQLGTSKQQILKNTIDNFIKNPPKVKEPFCIIIPSALHFSEEETLF